MTVISVYLNLQLKDTAKHIPYEWVVSNRFQAVTILFHQTRSEISYIAHSAPCHNETYSP